MTHDPEGDRILFDTIKEGLREDISLIEAPLQVNEEAFADLVVKEFAKLMSKCPPETFAESEHLR